MKEVVGNGLSHKSTNVYETSINFSSNFFILSKYLANLSSSSFSFFLSSFGSFLFWLIGMSAEFPFFTLSFSTSFSFFSIYWNANKNFDNKLFYDRVCFFSVVMFCSIVSFLGLAFTGGFALLNRISRLRRFPSGSMQGTYFWVFFCSPVESGCSLDNSN